MKKLIKKIIPYFFIFIILVGLFGPMARVRAQMVTKEQLYESLRYGNTLKLTPDQRTQLNALTGTQQTFYNNSVIAGATPTDALEAAKLSSASPPPAVAQDPKDPFKNAINTGCGWDPATWFNGCLLLVIYYTLFQLPSWILYLAAYFFDAMINLGIKSTLTSSSIFIPMAWAVVRDLSNIFFILILLYIAIQTILGLGHETKKMIVKVVIMALLINFSMFFTKVVIDSANILALVFYNKLSVDSTRKQDPTTPKDEKDISGEMWKTFDITKLVDKDAIKILKTVTVIEKGVEVSHEETNMPFALTLGIIAIAGSFMVWVSYAFFIAGIMFIGRLIELWILIIFSPFAFMSYTIPKFASIEYLGWDAWFKRLISTAFMAPIFMFFLYLILMMLPYIAAIGARGKTTILGIILSLFIPGIIIMAMLLKAVHFAKEGGGQFGEMALKGAKVVGGLALGAATGGAALAGRAIIGGGGGALAGKLAGAAEKRGFGRTASGLRDIKSFAQKSSFDVRNTPGVGRLAKAGGINLGIAQSGGWSEMEKRQTEKRKKRTDELEKKGTKKEKVAVEEAEIRLKEATLPVKLKLENADRLEKEAREEMKDAKITDDSVAFAKAKQKFNDAKSEKTKIKNTFVSTKEGLTTINAMEEAVRNAKNTLEVVGGNIRIKIATELEEPTGKGKVWRFMKAATGTYSYGAEKDAAREIRLGNHSSGGKKKDEDGKEKNHPPAPKDIKNEPKPPAGSTPHT